MGPMSIKEKCGKLKEKLIEFKEKAADGVQFLENIVEDLKNGSLIEADKLVAISKIYKEDADKRYKKIKWLVGYIKDLAKNKFIKDLFGIIGGKLEEFFTATETQWATFKEDLMALIQKKQGAMGIFLARISGEKENIKNFFDLIGEKFEAIKGKLMEMKPGEL